MLCVVGDFNIWIDVDGDKDGESIIDLMNSYGLEQSIDEPTQREGHTLDHVYFNPYQLSTNHSVINEPMGFTSDHYPIVVQIPRFGNNGATRTVMYRKLKDMDMEAFRRTLQDTINNTDFNDMPFAQHVTEIDRISKEVMDEYAPLVAWTKKVGDPQWMDAEYKKHRAVRRKFERKWRKDRSDENMVNYTEQKKRCTELALQKQTAYYSKVVGDAGKCQKTLFKVANELLDKNEERVLPSHTDAKALANEFNEFYVKKVEKIRRSIPEVIPDSDIYSQPFQGQPLEILRPTDCEEVEKIIKETGIKTSVEDPIPAKLIKSSLDILIPVYSELVNKSLAQ